MELSHRQTGVETDGQVWREDHTTKVKVAGKRKGLSADATRRSSPEFPHTTRLVIKPCTIIRDEAAILRSGRAYRQTPPEDPLLRPHNAQSVSKLLLTEIPVTKWFRTNCKIKQTQV